MEGRIRPEGPEERHSLWHAFYQHTEPTEPQEQTNTDDSGGEKEISFSSVPESQSSSLSGDNSQN